jgi:hypothetical protein
MNTDSNAPSALDSYEISPRFRQSMEQRIARLESDASADEAALDSIENEDHIRRHRRLITVQRTEALRMRLFLDRARPRLPRPLIAL